MPTKIFIFCALVVASTYLDAQATTPLRRKLSTPTVSAQELNKAASLATQYMVRANRPDGSFVYEINTLSGHESRAYNVLRHAGAIYALSSLDKVSKNALVEETIIRSSNYLTTNYMAPGPFPNTLAIWSSPHARIEANLGGTALGIIALGSARAITPEVVSIENIEALGRFILQLQRPDGSFVEKYQTTLGFDEQTDILYYPGEAALAFLTLYQIDASRVWLDAAALALNYLSKSRKEAIEVPADAWALIATAGSVQIFSHFLNSLRLRKVVGCSWFALGPMGPRAKGQAMATTSARRFICR